MLMFTSQTQRCLMFLTSHAMAGWSAEDATTFWDRRDMDTVMHYPVSQQRHDLLEERHVLCEDTNEITSQSFKGQRDLADSTTESIIHMEEVRDLQFWCRYQSWTYCPKCQKLKTWKVQPALRRKTPSPLHNTCKCGNSIYIVPKIEDAPLILHNLTKVGVYILRSLEIHWGNRNATSIAIASEQVLSGQYWSKQTVTKKLTW